MLIFVYTWNLNSENVLFWGGELGLFFKLKPVRELVNLILNFMLVYSYTANLTDLR